MVEGGSELDVDESVVEDGESDAATEKPAVGRRQLSYWKEEMSEREGAKTYLKCWR